MAGQNHEEKNNRQNRGEWCPEQMNGVNASKGNFFPLLAGQRFGEKIIQGFYEANGVKPRKSLYFK
jgi:hypothetical protein